MQAHTLRYQLPQKAIKIDCPACGPRHRKTLSRYIDTRTGEPLPDEYGLCDRVNNCGYHLGPYDKGLSSMNYADSVFEQFKMNQPLPTLRRAARQSTGKTKAPPCRTTAANDQLPLACCIPDELLQRSLSHYDQNQLATLLRDHFGTAAAEGLLRRFQIGTSSHWPGACIFWYIDELNRVRGGQIKLLGPEGHTVKYVDREGVKRSKTNWVHTVLQSRLEKKREPLPTWLDSYINNKAESSPCLFGLPQLLTAPPGTPVAIVEAPKTAIVATGYFPEFVWLAVGAKAYLNAERLAPLRDRSLLLWPDLDAYHDIKNGQGRNIMGWFSKATKLQAQGFDVEVSDFLERYATNEQRQQGLDLADFLLMPVPACDDVTWVDKPLMASEPPRVVTSFAEWTPGTMLRPDPAQLEYL